MLTNFSNVLPKVGPSYNKPKKITLALPIVLVLQPRHFVLEISFSLTAVMSRLLAPALS
jgi:hypothetical protein